MPVGELDMGQELLAGQPAARHSRADHELVDLLFLQVRVAQPRAAVAVVLLIHAMELEDVSSLGSEVVGWLRQFLGNSPAEGIALCLDRFDRAWLAVDRRLRIAVHKGKKPGAKGRVDCLWNLMVNTFHYTW